MPTNRVRRRRAPQRPPGVIEAIRTGQPIEYDPEHWYILIGAFYFGDHSLSAVERTRARELLDDWAERHLAAELAERRGI